MAQPGGGGDRKERRGCAEGAGPGDVNNSLYRLDVIKVPLKNPEAAEVVTGAARHLALLPELGARGRVWPVPFAEGIAPLLALRGRRVAVKNGRAFQAAAEPLPWQVGQTGGACLIQW